MQGISGRGNYHGYYPTPSKAFLPGVNNNSMISHLHSQVDRGSESWTQTGLQNYPEEAVVTYNSQNKLTQFLSFFSVFDK